MGRKWCPGRTDIEYVYERGYLHPVLAEQELGRPEIEPQPSANPSPASLLADLSRLHKAGLLTDEEYQAKRTEIIGQL